MRIIAKAKPIRIRIKSGGEEHSSLDSLRQNLCVQDLWPLVKDKRLSRWLRQLGEVELAHDIDALSESQLDFPTYFKVLVIFLKDDLVGRHVTELYTLFSFWHDCEKRKSKNYDSLLKYLLSKYEGAKFIFKQYPEELSGGEWWDVFCKYENEEDPEFLFEQGKLAFEGFTNFDKDLVRGKKLIEKAAELHYQKAVDFVANSNTFGVARKLAMLTPEAKVKIDSLIFRWKVDRLGFITKKTIYDEEIVWNVKQLLQEFNSLRKTFAMFSGKTVREEAKAIYMVREEAEAIYAELDESDIFYKERKFVLDLVKYYYNVKTPDLFVKLAEDYHYPLALYMIRSTNKGVLTKKMQSMIHVNVINDYGLQNRIDGFCFIKAKFHDQLAFILDHLFIY